jgi:hypothetical protein
MNIFEKKLGEFTIDNLHFSAAYDLCEEDGLPVKELVQYIFMPFLKEMPDFRKSRELADLLDKLDESKYPWQVPVLTDNLSELISYLHIKMWRESVKIVPIFMRARLEPRLSKVFRSTGSMPALGKQLRKALSKIKNTEEQGMLIDEARRFLTYADADSLKLVKYDGGKNFKNVIFPEEL